MADEKNNAGGISGSSKKSEFIRFEVQEFLKQELDGT